MTDKEKIESKISEIMRRRELLEGYKDLTLEEFMSEERALDYEIILHSLQVAIQATVDVAKHLCATKRRRVPSSAKELFAELYFLKIIDKALSEKLADAVGMRNVIVHQYEEVNPEKIFLAIQNNLNDFDRFVVSIGDFLKKEEDVKIGS